MQNANQNHIPAAVLPVKRFAGFIILFSLLTLTSLSGCGGGADSQSRPTPDDDGDTPVYAGAYSSDDVRAFKQEVWDKLSPSSVCGRCHRSDADPASRQAPYFVDWLDVNRAYDEVVNTVSPLVNLANPADSVLVSRVAGGHQCWLGSNTQCAAAMTKYIEAWANSSNRGETDVSSQLRDELAGIEIPTFNETRYFFPSTITPGTAIYTAYQNFYNLVTDPAQANCIRCHSSSSSSAITPYFADPNINTSYNAAKTVMDINTPVASRLYVRLGAGAVIGHNCWSNCPNDSQTVLNLITAIRDEIIASNPEPLFPADTISTQMNMMGGIVISSGNRYESNQIALYEFKNGANTGGTSRTISDTSGVDPALDLTIYGDSNGSEYRWLNNWGIEFNGGRAQASVESSRKLYNLIRLSGEYSIEAWVIPANVDQENASIIDYSGGVSGGNVIRNFGLGQTMYNYDFFQRSSTLDENGGPKLMTDANDQDLQATLQHVVITYDRNAGRRIYVNGEFTEDEDMEEAGDLLNWHPSYVLSFGSDASSSRPWRGTLRMVAIHDRSLSADQIRQNYAAEVGQKYLVPFNVDHLLNNGTVENYVVFEVNQFDEFSYLFRNPRFINVDENNPEYMPTDIPLRGLHIGMNGEDVAVGQAYTNTAIDNLADGYSPQTGLLLSNIDTVIQIQNGILGANPDIFFLAFEQLGNSEFPFTEPDQTNVPALPVVLPVNKPSDIGLRTFDEINAAMAQMTGISDWQTVTGITGINDIYHTYRRQFPATENIETFSSSHQMAISQLAMSYCNELVRRDDLADDADPTRYFAGFIYTATTPTDVTAAFGNDAQIIDPLLRRMLNANDLANGNEDNTNNLQTQPSVEEVKQELSWLIHGNSLAAPYNRSGLLGDTTCNDAASCTNRTKQIVTATCAAALGSAVMLIQ